MSSHSISNDEAKQHGGPVASRSTSSGEMLNLKDFELPDDLDLGSTFTAVTLPNEIKQGGEGEKGAVSREEGMLIHHSPLARGGLLRWPRGCLGGERHHD